VDESGPDLEDHPVTCHMCVQRMPLALATDHLSMLHGIDLPALADAPGVDETDEQ
jgi:hypothetical protein